MSEESTKNSGESAPGYLGIILAACLLLCDTGAAASESDSGSQSVPDRFFVLPLEMEADSGASNGDATILRVAPLFGRPSRDSWKIIQIDMLTLADAPGGVPGWPGNPEPAPGDRVFGIGDLLHGTFATPPSSGNMVWGFGAMLSVPIASDERLGSGKWSAGPAFRFAYRSELWNLGAFGGQIWSFAGSDARSRVSQLIVRGVVRRQLPKDWYFVSAPIVSANWRADGQKWLVPVGGGIGRVFKVKSDPWAWSVQGYYNVIKPDGAPNWLIRLQLVAAIPLGSG